MFCIAMSFFVFLALEISVSIFLATYNYNFLLCCASVKNANQRKNFCDCWKKKITSTNFDDLDNDTFLVNSFEEENNTKSFSDDDWDNIPVKSHGPVEIEIDMKLDEKVPVDDIVENLPRKQKFSNLDDILNLDNYEQLSLQKYAYSC